MNNNIKINNIYEYIREEEDYKNILEILITGYFLIIIIINHASNYNNLLVDDNTKRSSVSLAEHHSLFLTWNSFSLLSKN